LESKRVLLFGKNGQLGTELSRALADSCELLALGRKESDLERPEEIRRSIQDYRPEVVINAAAYTSVDAAEAYRQLAERVNAAAPGVIAEEVRRAGALLVHYSTDYVFDGEKESPYTEADWPSPLNVYGETKLEGERAVQHSGCRHFTFRISWLYAAHGKNFYRTVLRLATDRPQLRIVDDQWGSPTSAREVAIATAAVLENVAGMPSAAALSGIYHMTGPGRTTWCGFAKEIVRLARPDSAGEITPISTDDFGAPAKRPRNSVLNSEKLARVFEVVLPPWEEQLRRVAAVGDSGH
jgi:dTDP-4-dehydrorhamnose reductase